MWRTVVRFRYCCCCYYRSLSYSRPLDKLNENEKESTKQREREKECVSEEKVPNCHAMWSRQGDIISDNHLLCDR